MVLILRGKKEGRREGDRGRRGRGGGEGGGERGSGIIMDNLPLLQNYYDVIEGKSEALIRINFTSC